MKWFKAKYTYVLIVLSLLVSTGLQVVWLQQLFVAQKKQLSQDIDHLVSITAQTNIYYSINSFESPGNRQQIKQLFLSPQWEKLRRAFDAMKIAGVHASYSVNIQQDSTTISMDLSLKNKPIKKINRKPITSNTGLTEAQLAENDSLSLANMKKQVAVGLRAMSFSSKIYYNIFSYTDSLKVFESNLPKSIKPKYTSNKYQYNIQGLYRYQLLLPGIDGVVFYRMRYYLASSILMVLLTGTAFYFILRLLRNQQLYADAKADFTSNMTHEFKTPIATVSVALESIKKYNLINQPETLQNYLDISQHELRRLDLMVEKVLNISNGNETEQPLKLELYDVQSGLQQVISSMQLQLLNSHASINFNTSEEPCFVFGDPVHLTNVFYNLIDNAIKYAGTSLALDINCRCDANNVTLNFKDNGPGIDKIYHKNIFERFYRVPVKGDTHDIKGSGLGLHYVKQMVEKHNGTIRIKSEPGNGTNFIITLPAAS